MRLKNVKQKNNGFTLLEILIALFIFTIVAIILTHALHNALNAQEQTEKRAQGFSDLQHTLLIIARDTEQTINRPVTNFQGKLETAVLGDPDAVTLTHAGFDNPQGNLPRSTLQRVRYRMHKNDLVRDTWQALDQTPKSKPQTHILLHDVKSIHFDYLNDKKLFSEHWPEPDSQQKAPMPRAIRMTLVLKKQGKLEQTYIIPDQTNEQK